MLRSVSCKDPPAQIRQSQREPPSANATTQQHGTPHATDVSTFVLPWTQPVPDPKLQVRQTRRRTNQRHWRHGIADYRQAMQACRATALATCWRQAFRHMWQELRRDLHAYIGLDFPIEPHSHDTMHMVMKEQLIIDNRHASIARARQRARPPRLRRPYEGPKPED